MRLPERNSYRNSCGCSTHGAFDQFQAELDAAAFLMEDFTNIKGATVDEVGMLSCAMDTSSSPCILNGPTPRGACEACAQILIRCCCFSLMKKQAPLRASTKRLQSLEAADPTLAVDCGIVPRASRP